MRSYPQAGAVASATGRHIRWKPARSWAARAGPRLRRAAATVYGWLRADGQAVYMERASSRRGAPGRVADVRGGLLAWASKIRRVRAAVIVRRHLIAGLALAIVAAAVSILLDGERRAVWLAVPLVLALADATVAASRGVSVERAAQMLDRRLGLHDRLATALWILRQEGPPLGLRALVVAEAQAAVEANFTNVRLRTRRPGREWAAVCGGVAVLAVLAVLPGIGATSSARRPAVRATRTTSGVPGRPRSRSNATPTTARRQQAVGAQGGQINRPPLAVTNNRSPAPKGSGFSPYGHGGISLSPSQLAREGIASPSINAKALGAIAVSEAGGAGSGAAANAPATGAGAGAGEGKPGTGGTSSTTPTSRAGGSPSGAGALTPASGRHGASALTGTGTGKANGGAGAGAGGNSPPGGSGAGSAPGSTALRPGLVPVLGGRSTGLPLQAGFAPSSARRAEAGEGVSQTPNGGGNGGRSAHAGGGGQTSVSSSLGLIPPTFNFTSTLDRGVLSSYFGSANQLTPGNW